jgi:uncharacterized membrane protein (UPF0127 family)
MRKTLTMLVLFASLLAAGCGGGGEIASQPPKDAPESTTEASGSGGATGAETAVSELPTETVVIRATGGEEVEVTAGIADDNAERQKGLMARPEGSLPDSAGMLFMFGREQSLSFWMKDTLIPLSMAYIAADGRIVDIQDMEPLDETSHPSAEPAKYALEVNQGFFAERGVEVGDTVEIPQEYR